MHAVVVGQVGQVIRLALGAPAISKHSGGDSAVVSVETCRSAVHTAFVN